MGVLALGLSLGACAQSGFTDEGGDELPASDEGNVAKSLLISMGAIPDPHPKDAPKFQPRPALVVPPHKDLPTPVDQDALLTSKGFPVDPEVRAEKERSERLKNGGIGQGKDTSMTLAEQEKLKDLPVAGPPTQPRTNLERDPSRPLKPWELEGRPTPNLEITDSGPGARSRNLLTPPEDYRTPSPKAPLESPPEGVAALKPSWWPF
jgi:hypothetical protein